MSLILTLVRHGESTDNLKSLWAGHRDAPLSTHGMNQARRLGKSLEDVYITKIYSSDLKRAHWTALQIATQNKDQLRRYRQEIGADPDEDERAADSAASNGVASSSPPSSPIKRSGVTAGKVPKDEDAAIRFDLTSESEEEIAETCAGPSSLASTDRKQGKQKASKKQNGNRSYASVAIPTAAGDPDSDEYDDDFSASSSAAASSPSTPSSPSTDTRSVPTPHSLVTTTPLSREQFFGNAEGKSWKDGYTMSAGGGGSYYNRGFKFDEGESLEDVARRAKEVVERCVLPWLIRAEKDKGKEDSRQEHIVIVAHGIMISELLFALSKLQDPRAPYTRQSGHTNTGWTRLSLSLSSADQIHSLPSPSIPSLLHDELPPRYTVPSGSSVPRVTVRQTDTNITAHLAGLKRTKGGVSREAHDERQKSLKSFFGGGGSSTGSAATTPSASKQNKKPKSDKGKNGEASTVRGRTASIHSVMTDMGKEVKTPPEEEGQEAEDGSSAKRGIRLKSPPSPSPSKKGRLT